MKSIYDRELAVGRVIDNDFEKLTYVTSILRSLLQVVTVSAIELADKNTDTEKLALDTWVISLRAPADGMPVQILDSLIPHLRDSIHRSICTGWFERTDNTILSHDLQKWVEFRNKHQAHGVTDMPTAREWAQKTVFIIESCLIVFDELIPVLSTKGELRLVSNKIDCVIETPLVSNGHTIVISKVQQRRAQWKLIGQTLSQANSTPVIFELPESTIFNDHSSSGVSTYDLIAITTDNTEHYLEHNIPVRQTDTFEGREKEIAKLIEWFDDKDSRRCQIYGDGGYGKTTLLLEFMNRYIEGQFVVDNLNPSLICYYTAKMTRWNASGLKYLASVPPMMIECVRELLKALGVAFDKSLYSATEKQLISRVETAMQKHKLTRDDILLVVDNTETLASERLHTEELANLLRDLGKKLCRVVITSRRQESIEATPIAVGGLSLDDSINLLKRLAKEHEAKPILQAGQATLTKVSDKLMYKPILLEALVVYIARANISIDAALDNLYKKSEETLLEFLYDDAWDRLTDSQKDLFYLAISLSSELNDVSIGHACQLIQVQHSDFQFSLAETHFASMTDFGSSYEIELVELAKRFFEKKLSETTAEKTDFIKNIASQVDTYVANREKIELAYVEDRVADAFRNEFAKAAKVSVDRQDYPDADEYFKMAIQEEPTNAALHDRYAFFLLNKLKAPKRALVMAEKAVELNPASGDANVTLAMVHYREGDLAQGDHYIDLSKQQGRPDDFCFLRKGVARYHQAFRLVNTNAAIEQLDNALLLLNKARKESNTDTGYGIKNLNEIVKFQEMVRKRINRLSGKRVQTS